MKQIERSLLLVGLLVTSGCISTALVKNKAQPHLQYSIEEQQRMEVDGAPGYYALLPLTMVGDLATSPFQFVYFLFTDNSHSGSINVHGVPIPLP